MCENKNNVQCNLEELDQYLRAVDAAVCGGRANSINVPKPDFYIVCPCSGEKLFTGNDPMNGNVSVKTGNRPFDAYLTYATHFDAVDALQGRLTPAYKLYKGAQGQNSPYYKCWQHNQYKMFIVSTAWGIVKGDYELPDYEVDFIGDARLRTNGDYVEPAWANGMANAFNHLTNIQNNLPIVVLGGAKYIRRFLFLKNSAAINNPFIIFTHDGNIDQMCKTKKIRYVYSNITDQHRWYYQLMERI